MDDTRCKQALRRLHLFLDRELAPGEVAEVKTHLDECLPCRERFSFSASIKRLVHDRVVHENCPEDVKARLRVVLRRDFRVS